VDGSWAYLGSANFDPLSFRRNHELGMVVQTCPLVCDVEEQLFRPDLQSDWELRQPLPTCLKDYLCEMLFSLCL
jgi:phosphatidylserine/phosphatidylglycerophosphate/cardiolipin synthase-like enzyme